MMPVAGGAVKQLTCHPAEDMVPVCSPDGEKIAFESNRSGNMNVWVMPINGGEPQQLTFHTAGDLVCWSPDGKQLVFGSKSSGNGELYLIPSEGGDPVQLTHGKWQAIVPCYWSSDGQTIYAWGIGGPGNAGYYLWAVSASDGSARSLMDFGHSSKEPALMSSDGKRIYFTLWECVGDLWMAELETSKEK
jgi:Tol biopolymer transport system component